MRTVMDLLTNEEKIELEKYEEKIKKANTPLGILINRREANKLLSNAKKEFESGKRY